MTGRPGVRTYLVRTEPVPEVPVRTAVSHSSQMHAQQLSYIYQYSTSLIYRTFIFTEHVNPFMLFALKAILN